jgi:NADPH-dependent ferric siderophore reductase
MTDSTPLRSDDHNAGLHRITATVREIIRPSATLARIVLHVPGLREDPVWHRPNVSLRLFLGPDFGDVSRVYTVRSASDETESIEVDVVLHGVESPMMSWFRSLAIGHAVTLDGPRPHFQVPEQRGRRAAVFADDTAIPALFALLSDAGSELSGTAFVATDDVEAFDELPRDAGLDLVRIAPGHGFDEQALIVDDAANWVVWGAGERDEMKRLRRHFRGTVGIHKDDVAVYGYWKRGVSTSDIDAVRLRHYTELLAGGGTVTDMDDLALDI